MLFSSIVFLFTFLPVTLLVYYLVPGRLKNIVLLLASLVFYAWGEPVYVILMVLSILFNYVSGIDIERNLENPFKAKQSLVIAVAVNLLILGFFKYYGFLIESLNAVLPVELPYKALALPIGISFYTFQTMAYVIDVYRGEISAEKSPLSYALFVSFFPQLVAGPIERAGNLIGQLKEKYTMRGENLLNGFWLMLRGFYKKVVVADYLAVYVDKVYAAPQDAGGIGAVLGTAFFAVQIYCDFSGYTDIARGAARMMGIRLMENFRHPYRAVSIQDFWKRWHISLTCWFTDYVYIPLGGNRRGFAKRCRNVLIVFLLSGFWHGASWNFVVWGLIHGIYMVGAICLSQIRKDKKRILHPVAGWILTLLLVNIAWVFFRAPSLIGAWRILQQPFVNPLGSGIAETMSFLGIRGFAILRLLTTGISWLILERLPEEIDKNCQTQKGFCMAAVIFVVMVTVIEFSWLGRMASGGENAFIYFRF